MIKKQSLKSMASLLIKSCLINNDPFLNYPQMLSTTPNYGSSRAHIRFNLSNSGDYWDKDKNFKVRRDNGGDDVSGFGKMRAFALSKDPVSEIRSRGGGCGGGGGGGYSEVCHRDGSTGFTSGHLLPEKVSVAVDVDEVLGNFVSALNRFIADRYLSEHSVSEYYVYEFFKIWNCSRDEADVRVHEFFKTTYFKNGIHPIPGAQKALQKLARFCNLSIVTSRQNVIKDHTIQWIEKHYPGLFEEMHFGNHFALDGESKSKSEICRSVGARVLIDDNPRYALECAEVGIKVLLFDYENSYPWCKTGSSCQHPLVTKVHNWEEVEHQLVSWVFSSHL